MHTRTAAALAALLLATLTACSESDNPPSTASAKPGQAAATEKPSTPQADNSDAERGAGIPAEPTGAKRTALIATLKAVNPALVADEDKAIDNARNQCSTLNGGGDADMTAKARFSTSDHEVTDVEATAINEALIRTLC